MPFQLPLLRARVSRIAPAFALALAPALVAALIAAAPQAAHAK
jgi:hypothetical protein